ncbi:CBS domain-containing protein [Cryptosporangium minutisporangium]|uniref:CBS domain-containing protein n=1 Tax=Cryptosporangium minutisporangium TaxID=113569 RepID=A0ABP6T7X4_9ACTN
MSYDPTWDSATFWPDEDPIEASTPRHSADAPVTTVMRPCVVVAADEPITVAWSRIRDRGEVALVVDAAAHAVGLLGLRDVSAVWPVRPPVHGEPTAGDAVEGVRISRIAATTSVRAAIRQLLADRQGAAPVVSADGRALGLVTALDLLAALAPGGVQRRPAHA